MEIEIRTEDLSRSKIWYKKNNPNYWHREDGPALICSDGEVSWWYYGRKYEYPETMPLNLFLAYCKWEYNKNEN